MQADPDDSEDSNNENRELLESSDDENELQLKANQSEQHMKRLGAYCQD